MIFREKFFSLFIFIIPVLFLFLLPSGCFKEESEYTFEDTTFEEEDDDDDDNDDDDDVSISDWEIETIFPPGFEDLPMMESSGQHISLDPQGRVHILFQGEEKLYYGVRDESGEWGYETIFDGKVDNFSLAVDTEGIVHVLFYAEDEEGIKYGIREMDGTWNIEDFFSPVTEYYHPASLALDSSNRPHVSFTDDDSTLYYFYKGRGGFWFHEIVDYGTGSPSLFIDNNDISHIAYIKRHHLIYGKRENGVWNIFSIDDEVYSGNFPSLIYPSLSVDSNGNPHIFYYESESYSYGNVSYPKYIYFENGEWKRDDPSLGEWDILYSSMLLDSKNAPHIFITTSYGWGIDDFKYFYHTNSGWQNKTLFEYDYGTGVSATIDENDIIHGIFSGNNYYSIIYITIKNDINYELNFETPFSRSRPGANSVKIDSIGRIHIVFRTIDDGRLIYALFDGSNWEIETLNHELSANYYPSLRLDSMDRPHILYGSSSGLIYTYKDNDMWNSIEIGENCDYMSLNQQAWDMVLDHQDRPIIFCVENTYTGYHSIFNLKKGYFSGEDWVFDNIFSSVYHNPDGISAEIDNSGTINISFNIEFEYLNYLRIEDECIESHPVSLLNDYEPTTDIEIDSQGNIHIISFYNLMDHAYLKYFRSEDGENWEPDTIAIIAYPWYYNRDLMKIDSEDNIHIVYLEDNPETLKYAIKYGDLWYKYEVLTLSEGYFYFPSMILDLTDNPHIFFSTKNPDTGLRHAFLRE